MAIAPDPFALAAEIFDPPDVAARDAPWQPWPHQIPPPGEPGLDWFIWLLLGGRGAGKTDACAHYMNLHALGPPCLAGDVPHRMAIVAPTLGDASDACVNGLSGLKAHNPAITEITKKGGTFVNWSNGSQAKLFGAYTREEPERLRAGGNRCCAAGTLVATEHGDVPIELVREGMRVWTRNGLRRVLRAGQTGVRKCIELRADGRALRLTADHEVWTGDAWQQAAVADRLTTWLDPSSCGTASAGTSGRTATSRAADEGFCTGPSTPPSTDRFPLGFRSTTRTSTRPTTTPPTSLSARRVGTGSSITRSAALTGTASAGSPRHRHGHPAPTPARSAGSSSSIGTPLPLDSALLVAGTAARRHERSLTGCALCAAQASRPRDEHRPRLAATPVERSTSRPSSASAEPVYDLLVEHDHEFFANGFLVANCLVWMEEVAAWRYLAESWKHIQLGLLRSGPHPHAIASTTPRSRPTMRAIIKRAEKDGSLTHGRTDENLKLPEQIRRSLYEQYAGTRVGQQELEGLMIDEVVGALWTEEQVVQCHVRPQDAPATRERLVVAVDPSWGTTNDEVGIVAGYRGPDGHAYILEDLSGVMTPSEWGSVVARAYERLQADKVIAEGNFQGEQVRLVMKTAHVETGVRVNFDLVHASRGKVLRAEPVVALYEQGRVHHVGGLPGLEYQMTHWVPPRNSDGQAGDVGDREEAEPVDADTSEEAVPSEYSPDRVDALVFLVTDLLLGDTGPGRLQVARGVLPTRSGGMSRATGSPMERRLTQTQIRRGR